MTHHFWQWGDDAETEPKSAVRQTAESTIDCWKCNNFFPEVFCTIIILYTYIEVSSISIGGVMDGKVIGFYHLCRKNTCNMKENIYYKIFEIFQFVGYKQVLKWCMWCAWTDKLKSSYRGIAESLGISFTRMHKKTLEELYIVQFSGVRTIQPWRNGRSPRKWLMWKK